MLAVVDEEDSVIDSGRGQPPGQHSRVQAPWHHHQGRWW